MSASDAVTPPARPGLLALGATALATGLGSGYSPVAPGTAGSLVGLALYWPLQALPLAAQAAVALVVFLLGVAASTHLARRVGLKDPSIVVVDEIVGMWLSLALIPFTPVTAAVGFLLFRGMDVVKPFPARQLEHLREGWGIMADDVMAGVYANLTLRLALYSWQLFS